MLSRRRFIVSTATLVFSHQVAAQPAKVWRIGYLAPGEPEDPRFLQTFLDGLRSLGYVEGRNIVIERRSADGQLDALPALAEELVRLKVDVIVTPTTPVTRAAKAATSSIPIVFTIVSDPVSSGFVASLSHPGGNITGMTDMGVDLAGKRLQLLKQVVPRLKHVGALGHPPDNLWEPVWREAQASAHRLRIDIVPVLISAPNDLEISFGDLNRRVQALLVAPQLFFSVHRQRLIELASLTRLPAIYELREYPDAGGLMSYGPNYSALFRKAARHVDKILRGVKPADLPVEQPTEYELVVNLKTAKALGLTIPQSILVRAEDVIR